MHREELLLSPLAYLPPAQILEGLSAEDAARRVPGIPHSIVEIVAHLNFWQAWFLGRCAGVALPPVAHAANGWPTVVAADWAEARNRFLSDLRRAVELTATGLIHPPLEFPPMAAYGVDDVVAHLAQHNAHHLGQVIVLRQALACWPPPGGSHTW